jgi:hypothetical protein
VKREVIEFAHWVLSLHNYMQHAKRQKTKILLQLDDESGIINQYRQRLLQRRVHAHDNMEEMNLVSQRAHVGT